MTEEKMQEAWQRALAAEIKEEKRDEAFSGKEDEDDET